MIAFYYGMTGFACVWYYRQEISNGGRDLLMKGILPGAGGTLLLGAFLVACKQYAAPDYGNTTILGIGGVFVIGVGALLAGAVLMVAYYFAAPAYFRGETLPRRDLVLASVATAPGTLRLPDSGLPDIVIASDLSNLPPGERTVGPDQGDQHPRAD